ncbi:hypothetical protein RJ639_042242 [Escallonia herrerae]|uniref:Vesicle transport protein n=1 Tax=Escallonia herrerae TaxID=1293975 RepID=A0AA89B4R8_9ASTE|nr:hypothetical protein RJ639_042242 [Escallonia herrerae]
MALRIFCFVLLHIVAGIVIVMQTMEPLKRGFTDLSYAWLLSMLVFFNPIKFGITFSFGNLLSLGSTAFLIGPKRQISMMLDPVRIYATAIYIASIIVSLFCALYVHNKLLTLLAILLEFGALISYSLSYIPFARAMVSKVMVGCFDTEF